MEDSCSLSLVSYQATAKTDFTLPLHIPASVTHEGKTYPVKRIESNAFKGVTAVQSIIVEEGIETILDYAFECCTNLRSISIPASAEGIGKGLFGSCYNLTSVVVAADNEIYDSREGSNAIIDYNDELVVACSATTIPSSVKSIGTLPSTVATRWSTWLFRKAWSALATTCFSLAAASSLSVYRNHLQRLEPMCSVAVTRSRQSLFLKT